jgi:acyl dehydratase
MARLRHLLQQGPMLASIGKIAVATVRARAGAAPVGGATPELPGPVVEKTIAPLPSELVRDYVREVGGDAGAWKGSVPPHLFPQWGLPLVFRVLEDLSIPIAKMLNGGCRLEVHGRLPADQPLVVRARLESVDDNGRRLLVTTRITTGTAAEPELVVASFQGIVPQAGAGGAKKDKKDAPRVPPTARELAFWRLTPDNALAFATLTGDLNPVHWVPPYARAFGFKNVILHGFATMARTYEGLARHLYAGQVDRIAGLEARFTRPLVLPARVGLYLLDDGPTSTGFPAGYAGEVFVGDAPGGPAYLTGRHTRRTP